MGGTHSSNLRVRIHDWWGIWNFRIIMIYIAILATRDDMLNLILTVSLEMKQFLVINSQIRNLPFQFYLLIMYSPNDCLLISFVRT